jgi:hypothetical protein
MRALNTALPSWTEAAGLHGVGVFTYLHSDRSGARHAARDGGHSQRPAPSGKHAVNLLFAIALCAASFNCELDFTDAALSLESPLTLICNLVACRVRQR